MFDMILKDGRIVDGTGNPWFKADIGIKAQKIAQIGHLKGAETAITIDAKGLIVCPGFIDIHSHADMSSPFNPRQESAIAQGITTHIVGNCGGSLAPIIPGKEDLLIVWGELPDDQRSMINWTTFKSYLDWEEGRTTGNMIHLVGHGTLRTMGMGFDARAPTAEEMEEMKRLATEAMEAGAIGLSTGLLYPPGSFATTEELIELTKVISQYGGVYFTHLRSYSDELTTSMREALEIGKKADVTTQLSHISVFGPSNWGRSKEVLELVKDARAKGQEVSMDLHPYDSFMTTLIILLPPWTHDGGKPKLIARLKDTNERTRIIQDMKQGLPDWPEWIPANDRLWENILIAKVRTTQNISLEGKSLKEIAELREVDEFTVLFDLLVEEEGDVDIVGTKMRSEEDIIAFMKSPFASFETDGTSTAPSEGGKPHPRTYGTYPKILGEFVRERQVLSLESAIQKMTALPAQSVRLWNRGLLKTGMYADIVLFNPITVIDKATYTNPHQYSEGIERVMVNGIIVFQNSEHTGALPGKVLRYKNGQIA